MTAPPLPGRATPAGTRRGADSFGAGARTLGRTGLTVSPVGFGAARVTDASPLHRRALADALRGGVNLIDTSARYGDGGSERLVGSMLANLVQQGELRREQVVVVSKIGEPQPATSPSAGLDTGALEAQLQASLDRLGLETLDVVLLSDPQPGSEDAGPAFEQRIQRAFETLERFVADGRIGWYGVSSNGFAEPASKSTMVSVSRMVEIAEVAGGRGHHFGVVQMPMNLFELGATHPRGDEPSTLDAAATHDLGVLTHRPLNAFRERGDDAQLVRLASVPAEAGASLEEARARLAVVRKLEAQWATGLGKTLRVDEQTDAVDLFRWGQELAPRLDALGLEQWVKLRHDVVAVHLGRTSAALLDALEGELRETFATWWTAYGTALHEAFDAIEAGLRGRRRDRAAQIGAALDGCVPGPWASMPLSHKAVLTVLCAPVSSVLVGMRQPGYVHDILALRDTPVRLLSAGTGPVDFGAVQAAMDKVELVPSAAD
ncbi:MAG: aldo/keto reductase [Myxococcota bacterium]